MKTIPGLLACALLLVCASCVTAPSYKRMTSDDCLILIPTLAASSGDVTFSREFHFVFNDGRNPVAIPAKNEGFVPLLIRGPGLRLVSLTSSVSGTNVTGEASNDDLGDLPVPYQPGGVIVFDYTFTQKVTKQSSTSVLVSYDFVPTEDALKTKVQALFYASNDGGSWK